jgi:hypothetical protein
LEPLDAWDACFAVTFDRTQGDITEWSHFDDSSVVKEGLGFSVTIHNVRKQNEAAGTDVTCTVGGRLGALVVETWNRAAA